MSADGICLCSSVYINSSHTVDNTSCLYQSSKGLFFRVFPIAPLTNISIPESVLVFQEFSVNITTVGGKTAQSLFYFFREFFFITTISSPLLIVNLRLVFPLIFSTSSPVTSFCKCCSHSSYFFFHLLLLLVLLFLFNTPFFHRLSLPHVLLPSALFFLLLHLHLLFSSSLPPSHVLFILAFLIHLLLHLNFLKLLFLYFLLPSSFSSSFLLPSPSSLHRLLLILLFFFLVTFLLLFPSSFFPSALSCVHSFIFVCLISLSFRSTFSGSSVIT